MKENEWKKEQMKEWMNERMNERKKMGLSELWIWKGKQEKQTLVLPSCGFKSI